MIDRIIKGIAPAALAALSLGLAGCNMDVSVGSSDGVPLAELDMSGAAPTGLVIAGPDNVVVSDGETLTIEVDGDAEDVAELRFALEDGALAISRESEGWSGNGKTTVRVTMPSPETMVIAGSGKIDAQSLAPEADIVIGGSGNVTIATLAAEQLDIKIGGSGDIKAEGTAKRLEIVIGGSGNVDFGAVQVDRAEINIGGNGDVSLASDGRVEANIAGSGDIDVSGSAKCTLNSVGSGTLNCKPKAKSDQVEAEAATAEG